MLTPFDLGRQSGRLGRHPARIAFAALDGVSAWLYEPDTSDPFISLAVYPARLPNPQLPGYELQPQDSTLRSDMEVGPARVRRTATSMPTYVVVSWRFKQAEFSAFEAWFILGIHRGADWFSMPLANGSGVQPFQTRFIGPYKAKALPGLNWEVSAQVEVRDPPTMDEAALAAWIAGG